MHKQFLSIILWVIIIALSARITFDVPFTEINTTAQTLSILCMAILARPQISVAAILLYLIVGVLGMPVFSDGKSGWAAFTGDSLGYFVGFIFTVCIVSTWYWKNKSFQNLAGVILLLQILGTLFILTCGVVRLSCLMSWPEAISNGFTPFILPGIIKSLLGTIIVVVSQKFNLIKH